MTARGGIYSGPGGEKLYGDGREVEKSEPDSCPTCGSTSKAYRGNVYVPNNKIQCYSSWHESGEDAAH